MSAWLVTDFVLLGIAVVLLAVALNDWVSRDARRFPDLVYGGRQVSRRAVRLAWALILLLGFGFGHASPAVLASSSSTWDASSASAASVLKTEGIGSATSYESSRGIYLNRQLGLMGNRLTETKEVRLPLPFVLAILAYFFLVVRWSP